MTLIGLADDEMFQTFQAVFHALDFRFQQVVRIVEAAVAAMLRLWKYIPSR
jgi:hypothetical protein